LNEIGFDEESLGLFEFPHALAFVENVSDVGHCVKGRSHGNAKWCK